MIQIPLTAIPNQSISIRLDNKVYNISVKVARNVMAVTIVRDNVTVVDGMRATPGTPLIPYKYREDGNFIFITPKGDYPFYTNFESTDFMYFLSQAEIDALRDG